MSCLGETLSITGKQCGLENKSRVTNSERRYITMIYLINEHQIYVCNINICQTKQWCLFTFVLCPHPWSMIPTPEYTSLQRDDPKSLSTWPIYPPRTKTNFTKFESDSMHPHFFMNSNLCDIMSISDAHLWLTTPVLAGTPTFWWMDAPTNNNIRSSCAKRIACSCIRLIVNVNWNWWRPQYKL